VASVLISVSASEELEHLVGFAEGDSGGTSDGFNGVDVAAKLGGVSLVSIAFDSGTANGGAGAHNTSMDAAGDAVLLLDVDLGQGEGLVSGVLLQVSSGGAVNHLSHLEALDSFVLGHTAGAVQASDHVGMTLVLLPSSVVSSL
jgi:hypothetical protein